METCLLFFAAVLAPVSLWRLMLRHGRRAAAIAAASAALCGIIAALVARAAFDYDAHVYDETKVYPAEEWRPVFSLAEPPTGFTYRQDSGLFVTTGTGEARIAGVSPLCLPNGDIAQARGYLQSHPVELTTNPRLELPPPPKQPAYQVFFDVLYPLDIDDTDEYGTVGYAAFEDGEVWCSERFALRGQYVGVAYAFGLGFMVLSRMIISFVVTSLVVTVLAFALLEMHRRGKVDVPHNLGRDT